MTYRSNSWIIKSLHNKWTKHALLQFACNNLTPADVGTVNRHYWIGWRPSKTRDASFSPSSLAQAVRRSSSNQTRADHADVGQCGILFLVSSLHGAAIRSYLRQTLGRRKIVLKPVQKCRYRDEPERLLVISHPAYRIDDCDCERASTWHRPSMWTWNLFSPLDGGVDCIQRAISSSSGGGG